MPKDKGVRKTQRWKEKQLGTWGEGLGFQDYARRKVVREREQGVGGQLIYQSIFL